MSRKALLLIVMVVIAIAAGIYTCREFNRKNENISRIKPVYVVSAFDLIRELSENENTATQKYLGKVIAVKGLVKRIDHDTDGFYTIILGDSTNQSSVLCAMDSTIKVDAAKLTSASSVSVKGIFIGFEKDVTGLLGSDAKLNRCILQKQAP